MNIIEPLFEPSFIYDSYSCRMGKGTHAGVKRLRKFLGQVSRNDTRTVYALKCDIRQFFANVDHAKLVELLAVQIKDEAVLELPKEIITSYSMSPGKGIPLGNLTSQLFANVYMHEFDFFVKHNLCERYYLRYCDDFVIVSPHRRRLIGLISRIESFLASDLNLMLHPHKVSIRSWNQGIDFLGHVLKPNCTLIRTKTRRRMLAKVDENNLASYLGVCSHSNAHELEQLIKMVAWNRSNTRGYN